MNYPQVSINNIFLWNLCAVIGPILLLLDEYSESYYLDTNEEFDSMICFYMSWTWFEIRSIYIFPNNQILLFIDTAYHDSINLIFFPMSSSLNKNAN